MDNTLTEDHVARLHRLGGACRDFLFKSEEEEGFDTGHALELIEQAHRLCLDIVTHRQRQQRRR